MFESIGNFIYSLLVDPLYICFLAVGIGLLLGAIKIRGFSLGVSGVFMSGLIFGAMGLVTPKYLTTFGLLIFMYVLGIQGGPTFFNSFSKKGVPYLLTTLCMACVSILAALIFGKVFHMEQADILGVYTGTFNSSSSLAILMDGSWGDSLLPSYGTVFPLGAVAVVLFVQLLPLILRKNTLLEFRKSRDKRKSTFLTSKKFVVEEKDVTGKNLAQLALRTQTGATISRIRRHSKMIVPTAETELELDDVILSIGTEEALEHLGRLIGNETHDDMEIDPGIEARQFSITNHDYHQKALQTLDLPHHYGVIVTRVKRSGMELAPAPDLPLLLGDMITVVGKPKQLARLEKILGKPGVTSSELDLLSMAIAIAVGIAVGKLVLPLPVIGKFTLGLSGGVLLVGLLLGYLGRFGILTNQISSNAKNVIKDIGLAVFLAGVGVSAGAELGGLQLHKILMMLLLSLIILVATMTALFVLCYRILKMNFVKSLACLCGAMINSAALGTLTQQVNSDEPSNYFATCYPLASFGSIIATQILAMLV